MKDDLRLKRTDLVEFVICLLVAAELMYFVYVAVNHDIISKRQNTTQEETTQEKP
jgi:hypothetical protein